LIKSDAEKDDLLLQLHALRDADLVKLGREALLAEFQGKPSTVDTASTVNGAIDDNEFG
jgi:hypothetical protein